MDAGRLAGASAVPLPSGELTATVGVLRRPLSSEGGEAAGVRVPLLIDAGDDAALDVGARRLDSLRGGESADVEPAMLQQCDAWTDAVVNDGQRVKLSPLPFVTAVRLLSVCDALDKDCRGRRAAIVVA